jgi:hypothetical protein
MSSDLCEIRDMNDMHDMNGPRSGGLASLDGDNPDAVPLANGLTAAGGYFLLVPAFTNW